MENELTPVEVELLKNMIAILVRFPDGLDRIETALYYAIEGCSQIARDSFDHLAYRPDEYENKNNTCWDEYKSADSKRRDNDKRYSN